MTIPVRASRGGPTSALARIATAAAAALLVTLLGLPVASLFLQMPPGDLLARLDDPPVLQALRLSLVTSTAATGLVVLLGLPTAYLLATRAFPGRRLVEILVLLPMVLPPTVAGLALLMAFGRAGLAGEILTVLGLRLPFTTLGVVVAQAFMAAPFFIAPSRAAIAGVDPRYVETARTLRGSELYVFRRVTLPLSAPALLAGAVMSWARALGEFGATITFAGNFPGRTQTMPLAVYGALQTDLHGAVALSALLVAVAVAVLAALGTGPGAPLGWLRDARDRRRPAPRRVRA